MSILAPPRSRSCAGRNTTSISCNWWSEESDGMVYRSTSVTAGRFRLNSGGSLERTARLPKSSDRGFDEEVSMSSTAIRTAPGTLAQPTRRWIGAGNKACRLHRLLRCGRRADPDAGYLLPRFSDGSAISNFEHSVLYRPGTLESAASSAMQACLVRRLTDCSEHCGLSSYRQKSSEPRKRRFFDFELRMIVCRIACRSTCSLVKQADGRSRKCSGRLMKGSTLNSLLPSTAQYWLLGFQRTFSMSALAI